MWLWMAQGRGKRKQQAGPSGVPGLQTPQTTDKVSEEEAQEPRGSSRGRLASKG